jgi:hypothetical protein
MITSLEKLGTHAGLSKEHARRCLDYLGRTQNATLERTHQYTMISVMNWATYQQVGEDTQHAEHHADHHSNSDSATRETPQRTPRATTPSKEVKNLNKKYTSDSNELDGASAMNPPKPTLRGIDPAIRAWFDGECWPLYPRREVKQPALKAEAANATTPEKRAFYLARLKSQLPAYVQRKSEAGQRVIPMPATWFNQGRAEDELDVPVPPNGRLARTAAQSDYPE